MLAGLEQPCQCQTLPLRWPSILKHPFTHQNRAGLTSRRSWPRSVSGAPASLCTVHGAVSEAAPEAIRPHALSQPSSLFLLNKTRPQTKPSCFSPTKSLASAHQGTPPEPRARARTSAEECPGDTDAPITWAQGFSDCLECERGEYGHCTHSRN